ncbi:hypothetical protein KY361_05550 [Candidatus Woesearchaeota archaeon]|nr:hypothetical protein [Candidatus Woesearchaeota archaeon]
MSDTLKRLIDIALEGRTAESRIKTLEELAAISGFPEDINQYLEELRSTTAGLPQQKLEYLMEEANKVRVRKWGEQEAFDIGDILVQIRRGGAATSSDEEIIRMLQEGTWMSAKEVKEAGSPYSMSHIRTTMKDEPDIETRADGRLKVCYFTPQNFGKVGLCYGTGNQESESAAKPAAPKQTKATIRIGNTAYDFEPRKYYTGNEVSRYLVYVHPGIFGDPAVIDRIMEEKGEMKDSERMVLGSALIEMIRQVNGMMILSSNSTKKRLTTDLGVSYERFLDSDRGQSFVHSMPGIFREKYVLKEDIPKMRELMHS